MQIENKITDRNDIPDILLGKKISPRKSSNLKKLESDTSDKRLIKFLKMLKAVIKF